MVWVPNHAVDFLDFSLGVEAEETSYPEELILGGSTSRKVHEQLRRGFHFC